MFHKGTALRGIIFLAALLWGAVISAGDTVSTPKRIFGLGDVKFIAISSDLRFLATSGQGGAYLWDAETATIRERLKIDWTPSAMAFSPDGKSLAVASRGTIFMWETETGNSLPQLVGHRTDVNRLQFTPDGKQLISASSDNTVRIWSLENATEIGSMRTPGSPILDVSLSPDGQMLATVDTFLTNCVKVWDISTASFIGVLPKTNWTAHRCIYTPQGDLVTTGADREVILWNPKTGEKIRSFEGITANVTTVDLWMPNDSTVAAICNDGTVYLWNIETAQLLRTVPGERVIAATGVPNEHLTITAQIDHNVRIHQLPGGDVLRTFRGHTTSVHSGVAFSPDGKYVLSGGTEASTRLWDRKSGQMIREFIGSPAGTMAAAFSPDGSRVLTTAGSPPAALLWKTETGELDREFKWTGGWTMGAVFSPDGTMIAARSQGDAIRIFDVATGGVKRTLPNTAFGGGMAFSPTAPLFAAASVDFSVNLYNHESGQLLHTFSMNAGPVVRVAFSPNGDTLLVAWQEGLIHLYNTFTMELRREFIPRPAFLETAAYSPDGQFILTGEGWPLFTATLWDAKTLEPVRTFEGHKWSVSAVGFNRDGTSILTGADMVREWSIASIAARLQFEKTSGQTRLTWSVGQLQHAAQPTGPWQTVTNAISPLITPATGVGFYRVRVEESAE